MPVVRDLIINSFVQKEQKIKIPFSSPGFLQHSFVILFGGISRDMWVFYRDIQVVTKRFDNTQLMIIPTVTNFSKDIFNFTV